MPEVAVLPSSPAAHSRVCAHVFVAAMTVPAPAHPVMHVGRRTGVTALASGAACVGVCGGSGAGAGVVTLIPQLAFLLLSRVMTDWAQSETHVWVTAQ